uniref:Uncharacterized protein n=1 Tax=Arundo donax TaxID=35708 RepID=A0A0A9B9I8_ARUDO
MKWLEALLQPLLIYEKAQIHLKQQYNNAEINTQDPNNCTILLCCSRIY